MKLSFKFNELNLNEPQETRGSPSDGVPVCDG